MIRRLTRVPAPGAPLEASFLKAADPFVGAHQGRSARKSSSDFCHPSISAMVISCQAKFCVVSSRIAVPLRGDQILQPRESGVKILSRMHDIRRDDKIVRLQMPSQIFIVFDIENAVTNEIDIGRSGSSPFAERLPIYR